MKFPSKTHPFHMVSLSPWPLITSWSLLLVALSAVVFFHSNHSNSLLISILALLLSMALWWKDVIVESTMEGYHSSKVVRGLKIGFILFIVSEAFFFLSVFWAFFHSALSPTEFIGNMWPPAGIESINPWGIPFLNTIILLSSGVSVTWSHHSFINNNRPQAILGLIITILLAIIFTLLQVFEYYYAPFTFADSVYGSTFFFSTGFHAVHVLIGTIFLSVCLFRMYHNHMSDSHSLGYEFAILYWHGVDIIWIVLFIFIYIWGS